MSDDNTNVMNTRKVLGLLALLAALAAVFGFGPHQLLPLAVVLLAIIALVP